MITFSKIKQAPITEIVLGFIALLFLFPGPYHTVPELDSSWQVVLEEGFFNQWQFGKDIIFTGGPLSFLYGPTSIGYFPKTQVLLEAAVLFTAIFSILYAIRKETIWVKVVAFFIISCGAASSRDGVYLISVSAIAFQILRSDRGIKSFILPIAFIVILGLMKFTAGVLGALCLGFVACLRFWDRNPKEGIQLIGSFILSIVAIWTVIGQSPLNLPAFFIHSLSLSTGYAWGMHLQEPEHFLKYLVFILLVTSLPIFIWTLKNRGDRKAWAVLFISAISVFICWKTGINRFGNHIVFFLQAAALVPLLLLPFFKKKRIAYGWTGITLLIFVWSYFFLLPTNKNTLLSRAISQSTFGLKFLGTAGGEVNRFIDVIPHVKFTHTLTKIKSRIGEDSVDVLHYHHGILILNELNYLPRPTIQNYAAYNAHLAKLNLDHMLSNPPKFIICRDGVIDSRYPTIDDNLFFKEVLNHYIPVLKEEDYLLLERTKNPPHFAQEFSVLKTKIISGQTVDISEFSTSTLWAKMRYEPSLLHKLAATLYKPEFLLIQVTTLDGESKLYRLIGANLENGFLLSPKLETIGDIENFLNDNGSAPRIKDITIHSVPGNTPFPTHQFDLELFSLDGKPLLSH